MISEQQLYLNIYRYGKYFFPARLHYHPTDDIDVGCDRCRRIPLIACIGWRDHDLCLACATEVEEHYEGVDIMDNMDDV